VFTGPPGGGGAVLGPPPITEHPVTNIAVEPASVRATRRRHAEGIARAVRWEARAVPGP
jgi:hypothetical protein